MGRKGIFKRIQTVTKRRKESRGRGEVTYAAKKEPQELTKIKGDGRDDVYGPWGGWGQPLIKGFWTFRDAICLKDKNYFY